MLFHVFILLLTQPHIIGGKALNTSLRKSIFIDCEARNECLVE